MALPQSLMSSSREEMMGRKKPTSAKEVLPTVVLRQGQRLQGGRQGFSIRSSRLDKLTQHPFRSVSLWEMSTLYLASVIIRKNVHGLCSKIDLGANPRSSTF